MDKPLKTIIREVDGTKYYFLGEYNKEYIWVEEMKFYEKDQYWSKLRVATFYVDPDEVPYWDLDKCELELASGSFMSLLVEELRKYDKENYVGYGQVIDEKDIYKFADYIETINTLVDYILLLSRGSSFILNGGATYKDTLQNEEELKRLNTVVMPEILKEFYKLLGGE